MVMETDGCKYRILYAVALDVNWFLTSSTGWSALSASGNSECLLRHLLVMCATLYLVLLHILIYACSVSSVIIPFLLSDFCCSL